MALDAVVSEGFLRGGAYITWGQRSVCCWRRDQEHLVRSRQCAEGRWRKVYLPVFFGKGNGKSLHLKISEKDNGTVGSS